MPPYDRWRCPDCTYRCIEGCQATHRSCLGGSFGHHRYVLGDPAPLELRRDPADQPGGVWDRYLDGDR